MLCVFIGVGAGWCLFQALPAFGFLLVPVSIVGVVLLAWLCRDPFRLYLWFLITWPLLWPARISLPAGMPDLAYERVLGALAVVLTAVSALSIGRWNRLGWPAWLFFIAQMAMIVRYYMFGGYAKPAFGDYINFVILPLTAYWLTTSLVISRRHLQWLLAALVVATIGICFTGLYERIFDLEHSAFTSSTHNDEGATRYLGVPGGRAAGTMRNPAVYGAVMGIGVLVCLCLIVHARRWSHRGMLLVAMGTLLYGVFVSYTRSAWLSVAISLFFVQFFIKDLWRLTLPVLAAAGLAVLVMWGSFNDDSAVMSRLMERENALGRVDRAVWALGRFAEKPIVGWGSGANDHMMDRDFAVSGFRTSHNSFLSLLVNGGLVLFLTFLIPLLLWSKLAWEIYNKPDSNSFEHGVVAAMAACILIYCLSGMAIELRYFGYLNALLWLCGGVIESIHRGYGEPEVWHSERMPGVAGG